MTLIINESNKGTAPKVSSSSPLDCKLAQSSVYRKAKDLIQITRGRAIKLDISFHRTLRVPDGKGDSELPPSMGTFPLYSVANYTKRLPKDMAAKGGLFLPMYQREAMWISFKAEKPFAIQVFVGGVNAVSGEVTGNTEAILMRRLSLFEKKKSIQDYVVTPKQLWIDGIATDNEHVRQFVAMPLGSGYTVEAQVTGQDLVGGLQIHITPSILLKLYSLLKAPNPPGFDDSPMEIIIKTLVGKVLTLSVRPSDWTDDVKLQIEDEEGIPVEIQRLIGGGKLLEDRRSLADHNITNFSAGSNWGFMGGGPGPTREQLAMGLAPGGLIKQCIKKDDYPSMIWDREQTICFNVQILNSDMFQQVTGVAAPPTPVSAKTYADQGLPFYKIYAETSIVKGDFSGVKSLKALDKIKNENGKRKEKGHNAHVLKKPKECEDELDEYDIMEDDDNGDSDDHGKSNKVDTESHSDGDDDEQPLQNPVILLNSNGSAMGKFTPVSELVEELSRLKLRKSELLSSQN